MLSTAELNITNTSNHIMPNLDALMRVFTYIELDHSLLQTTDEAQKIAAALKNVAIMVNDAEQLINALIKLYELQQAEITTFTLLSGYHSTWKDAHNVNHIEKNYVEKQLDLLDTEIHLSGLKIKNNNLQIELEITADFLNFLFNQLYLLFQAENNRAALETINKALNNLNNNKDNNENSHLAILKNILEQHIASSYIARIMQNVHATSAAKTTVVSKTNVKGVDVIALLGATGTGKSTTVHILAGSTMEERGFGIYPVRSAAVAEFFHVSETLVTSETTQCNSLDLTDPTLRNNYQLKKPIHIIDTPGFGDTGGGPARIGNGIKITDLLQTANSVRFLVLFSTTNIGSKGETLLSVLESVARLIADAEQHKKAIYYAFTGNPHKNFIDKIDKIITDLIQEKEKKKIIYSDNVTILLKDMQKKLKQARVKPIINAIGKVKITPQQLIQDILALEPMTDPSKEIVPFIEKSIQDTLINELRRLLTTFNKIFLSLQKTIADGVEKNFMPELQIATEKLEQIAFINIHLKKYDTEHCFQQGEETILNFAKFLIDQTKEIFNQVNVEKKLTELDTQKYHQIQLLYANLQTLWLRVHENRADINSQTLQSYTHHKLPVKLAWKSLNSVTESYYEALKQQLKNNEKLQLIGFEHHLQQQLLMFIENIKNKQFVILDLNDEKMAERVNNTLAHFKLHTIEELTIKREQHAQDITALQQTCGKTNLITATQNIVFNLILVEQHFDLKETTKTHLVAANYFQLQINTLSEIAQQYLRLHDFQTVAIILDNMYAMNEAILNLNEPEKMNAVKVNFVNTIAALVSPLVNKNNIDKLITEIKTKQFIYVMELLIPLDTNKFVTHHLKEVTTKENPYTLNNMYYEIIRLLKNRFQETEKSINDILSNEENIQGIHDLNLLLQQLWYIASVPTAGKEQTEHTQRYQSFKEKIKAFVSDFRYRFCEGLKTNQCYTDDNYNKLALYLQQINEVSSMGQVALKEENNNKLMHALTERFNRLLSVIEPLELQSHQSENILQYAATTKEINSLHIILAHYLSDEDKERLQQAIARFNFKIETTLTRIRKVGHDDEQFKLLPLTEIIYFSAYIEACETTTVLPVQTATSRNIFENAIKQSLQTKMSEIEKDMATLADWQAFNSTNHPTLETVIPVVMKLTQRFNDINDLRQALPNYYQLCDVDPHVHYENQLIHNLKSFSEQFNLALSAKYANENKVGNAENRPWEMVNICEQLKVFDDYLPTNMLTLTIKSYSNLYTTYKVALSETYNELFNTILRLVRTREYQQAIQEAEKIEFDAIQVGVRDQLCLQTTPIINFFADEMNTQSQLLQISTPTQPPFLTDFLIKLKSLVAARELKTAGLLTDAGLQHCVDSIAAATNAINAWFQQCIKINDQLIASFQIQDFIIANNALEATVATMQLQPTDWENAFRKTAEKLTQTLQHTITQFERPIIQWHNYYSLHFLYRQLAENDYQTTWDGIAQTVIATVTATCTTIKNEIAANSKNVENIITSIQLIAQQIIDVPTEEKNHLVDTVLERCQQILTALIANMLAADIAFEDYFQKTCILLSLQNQAGLQHMFKNVDFTKIIAPLQQKINELLEKISQAFTNKNFPKAELLEFMSIYEHASPLLNNLTIPFDTCRQQLTAFSHHLLQQISQHMFNYQNNNHTHDDLQKIVTACQQLVLISHCRKEMPSTTKILFNPMLPENFSTDICHSFQLFLTLFNQKIAVFNQALITKNAEQLKETLDFMSTWENIIAQIAQYMIACEAADLQTPLPELSELINKYPVSALIELIKNAVSDALHSITMDISTYLKLPEKSEYLRQFYFEKLNTTLTFITHCSIFNKYLDVSHYQHDLITATTTYLKQLYTQALKELPDKIENKNWQTFNDCYKELSLFSINCTGNPQLANIQLDLNNQSGAPQLLAIDAARNIEIRFKMMLEQAVNEQKNTIDQANIQNTTELSFRENIIQFLINLQRMINSMPTLSEHIKTVLSHFLAYLREKRGIQYIQLLATELQKEKSGLGQTILQQQNCFSGIAIALRNTRTNPQDIEYILKHLQQKKSEAEISSLPPNKIEILRKAFHQFQTKYDELIAEYLKPELNFNNNPEKHLHELLTNLQKMIANNPVQLDANNKIIWNNTIIEKIPNLVAYLFAIWTLRDSKAYFDAGISNDRINYLKKPHPAQVIAIFNMLNLVGDKEELSSHLVQVLSGEGKSIVIAVIAEILALLGFSVNCACYSKYLSLRDFTDFEKMFELLGVKEYIKYGTYNNLLEDILNKQFDLREDTEHLIINKTNTLTEKNEQAAREEIVIVDEIDVLFKPEVYGAFYHPVLRLNNDKITDLIDTIWNLQKTKKQLHLSIVKQTPQYQACIQTLDHDWHFLVNDAIEEMLEALKNYQSKDKHAYEVMNGKIAYSDGQDGMTTDANKGYLTMWAYMYESARGKIDAHLLNQQQGLLVNCGTFSYTEMIKNFRCLLGATGTLSELSLFETKMIREEFLVQDQTFMPSAYGPNHLKFHPKDDVCVAEDDQYHYLLTQEIFNHQKGSRDVNEPIRPVIIFFDTIDNLMTYYHSQEFKNLNLNVNVMTKFSSSTIEEKNAEIIAATAPGQITLALSDDGRGRDYICLNENININGGPHVIDAYFPDQLCEETQDKNRTGRQGGPGSYSMVLNKRGLEKKYNLTADEIEQMKKDNNVYAALDKRRRELFAATYGELKQKMVTVRDALHKPSLAFYHALQAAHTAAEKNKNENQPELIHLLQTINNVSAIPTQSEICDSHTLILMDVTFSMDKLIDGVKDTVQLMMTNLRQTLVTNNIDGNAVEIELAGYRNYASTPKNILIHSDMTSDSAKLETFIKSVKADDGEMREAIEIGLWHALQVAEKSGLTLVILIGDMPPNTPADIKQKISDSQYREAHKNKFGDNKNDGYPQHVDQLLPIFKQKNIPIFTFFVKKEQDTKNAFAEIAEQTGGTVSFLDVSHPETASQELQTVLGNTILTNVARGNKQLENKLHRDYEAYIGANSYANKPKSSK